MSNDRSASVDEYLKAINLEAAHQSLGSIRAALDSLGVAAPEMAIVFLQEACVGINRLAQALCFDLVNELHEKDEALQESNRRLDMIAKVLRGDA